MLIPCKNGFLFFLLCGFLLLPANVAFAHGTAEHLDPELFISWNVWLHLGLQWTHLIAFALWLGLTGGTLLLGIKTSLDHLLYSSWLLFLVLLATGSYNMEFSAGISETPSLFLLPLLDQIPYGVTYTLVLAVKVGLYSLAILLTFVITVLHMRRQVPEARLRQIFLLGGSALGTLIVLATAVVLFYHEVADLWPTVVHSLGGILGPEGPRGRAVVSLDTPPPNDFRLLVSPAAWADITLRWVHLLGFGLWLGGMLVAVAFGGVPPKKLLWYLWTLLMVQILSGIGSVGRWTPFYITPYIWNFSALSHVRFGWTYTLFLTVKEALVIAVIGLMLAMTHRYLKVSRSKVEHRAVHFRPYLFAEITLGLLIAYIMMMVLLVHEGVDHAL
ncbi:MAG: hypothetical protein ACE5HC_12760 [Candidatus Binatia bacterium]